jgi:anti-sigma factor RsiW
MLRDVTNARLCAFMDGECGPTDTARMELALDQNPQLIVRLATWRRNDDALRFAFADATRVLPSPGNANPGEPAGLAGEAEGSAGPLRKTDAPPYRGIGAIGLAIGLGAALAGAGSRALGLL